MNTLPKMIEEKNCTRLAAALSLALVFALGMSMPAFAAPPFELDGNATSNDFPGDDWDVVNQTPPGGNPIARTGLIVDLPEPATGFNQFQTGGSKDQQDIPNWRHTGGSPPDKDDITNAYAAAYVNPDNDHLIIVFGIDRFDNSGDAQLGFWFLQDDVKPVAGGTFNGVHVDGDLLVLVNSRAAATSPPSWWPSGRALAWCKWAWHQMCCAPAGLSRLARTSVGSRMLGTCPLHGRIRRRAWE